MWSNHCGVDVLVGKTLKSVVNNVDEIIIETVDNETYKMYHMQSCCEDVSVDDIIGDLDDLIGSPILTAEERTSTDPIEGQEVREYGDGFTWTFYEFATIKGSVTIRWYGTSNGYYSESVSFARTSG